MEQDTQISEASENKSCCNSERVKRVRWSVDLEEVFFFVPPDGIGRKIQKRIKQLKEKANSTIKETRVRSFSESDVGTTFEKIIGTGFEIFAQKLKFRSKALDFESIRGQGDNSWEQLFEQYSAKEFRYDIETLNDKGTSTKIG